MGPLFNKVYSALLDFQNVRRWHLLFWAASGPLFLFGAFALLLFRASWEMWPFVLLASSGLVGTFLFQRKGFYTAFLTLLFVSAIDYQIIFYQPLCALFLAATVFSWGIALLGQEEIEEWLQVEEEKKEKLEQRNQELQECVAQAQKEPRLFDEAFKAALASRNAAIDSQHRAYEEIEKLRQNCDALNQEIASYQRKEKAFQAALEDAQVQVLKYKYAEPLKAYHSVNPIISQEEEVAPPLEMRELQHRYAQLRAQFEEKSDVLKEARKEIFSLQGQILILEKEDEEKRLASDPEDVAYQMLIERYQDLETELQSLEQITSALSIKKTASPQKTGKKKPISKLLRKVVAHNNHQYSLLD